jgi:hypothetical protein
MRQAAAVIKKQEIRPLKKNKENVLYHPDMGDGRE